MRYYITYTYYDTTLRRQFFGSMITATDPRADVDAMQRFRKAIRILDDELPHVVSVIEVPEV